MRLFFKCIALFLCCVSSNMHGADKQEEIFQQYKPRFIFQCTDGLVALDDEQHARLQKRTPFFARQTLVSNMPNGAVSILNSGEYAYAKKDVETLLNTYDIYKSDFFTNEKEHYSTKKYSEHHAQINNCFKLAYYLSCEPYIGFIKGGSFRAGYTFHWTEQGKRYIRTIELYEEEQQDAQEKRQDNKQCVSYGHLCGLYALHGMPFNAGSNDLAIHIEDCHLNLALNELMQLLRVSRTLNIKKCTGTIFDPMYDDSEPRSEALLRLKKGFARCIQFNAGGFGRPDSFTLIGLVVSRRALQRLADELQQKPFYIEIEKSTIPTLDWAALQALHTLGGSLYITKSAVKEIEFEKNEISSLVPLGGNDETFDMTQKDIQVSVATLHDAIVLQDHVSQSHYLSRITCKEAKLLDIVELFRKQRSKVWMNVWIKIYGPLMHDRQELIAPHAEPISQNPVELELRSEFGERRNIHIKNGDIKMHSGDLITLYQSLLNSNNK
ncbi:MAG: hypothetical protein WCE21_00905 [Candidatus Babeliales bacterium]